MIDYINDLPRIEMMVLEKKKIEVLSEADEKDLFITYLKTRDKMLRTYLIYRNLGLVYHIANSYSKKIELEELYQEGIIGLTKAIECFDPFKGIRFSSYGCQWIKQAISRYISTKNTQVRIPAYLSSCYYTICNSDISDWEYADIKIIASKYNISENTAKFLVKVRNIESLDYAIEGESSVLSNVSSGKETPEDIILDNEMKQILDNTLYKLLSERDIYILKLRYGMVDGKEYTLKEIGEIVKLSDERVRCIIKKSIIEIQDHFRKIGLLAKN